MLKIVACNANPGCRTGMRRPWHYRDANQARVTQPSRPFCPAFRIARIPRAGAMIGAPLCASFWRRGSELNPANPRGYGAILRARPYPYHHSYHLLNMLMYSDRDSTQQTVSDQVEARFVRPLSPTVCSLSYGRKLPSETSENGHLRKIKVKRRRSAPT
jgi:hypothetical protein